MVKIIHCGHWDNPPEGWVSIPEQEQDITQVLKLESNSVDNLFNEHGLEHVPIIGAIHFLKESLRVLKHGGILRIATPTVDKLIQFKEDKIGKHYCAVQTAHYYKNEDAALKELGFSGIDEAPMAFMMDSLFKGHNHRFLWDSKLLKKVIEKIGFSEVYICEPGHTNFNKEDCLERTVRGVNPDFVKAEYGIDYFDPETMVVEAKK